MHSVQCAGIVSCVAYIVQALSRAWLTLCRHGLMHGIQYAGPVSCMAFNMQALSHARFE